MKNATSHRSSRLPRNEQVIVLTTGPERDRLQRRAGQITAARDALRQQVRRDAEVGRRRTALSRVFDEFTVELHQVQARIAALDHRSRHHRHH